MAYCYFVSDFHGKKEKYNKLYHYILQHPPDILFLGGDVLPHGYYLHKGESDDFIENELVSHFKNLKKKLGERYPKVYLILGNDDPRSNEERIARLGEEHQLWEYIHNRHVEYEDLDIYGYSFIPPSPFGLKDWEKYDVSRFVDPGCSHPSEGMRTIKPDYDPEYENIKDDLQELAGDKELSNAIFLFHSPPYDTPLDRAALDGKMVDHVPMDVHVGSIAIQRFINERQPLLTLHGHIHEASSITGEWNIRMGDTLVVNSSYDGKEMALVRIDTQKLDSADRLLI